MTKVNRHAIFLFFFLLVLCSCSEGIDNEQNIDNTNFTEDHTDTEQRADGAYLLDLDIAESLQNPAWSPGGNRLFSLPG